MTSSNGTPAPDAGGGPAGRGRPTGADRARDEMIADIDGRLRRHEGTVTTRLAQLDTNLSECAGLLAEALPRLDDLGEAVAEMAGRVDKLAGRTSDTAAILPVCWPALSAEDAEAAWDGLADWIGDVLGPWYQVRRRQVPDCWALHRPVVLHLSWLHRAWLAAHTGPAASPAAAAEWHARWLPAALDAIRTEAPDHKPNDRNRGHAWADLCRPGHHHDPIPTSAGTRHDNDQYRDPLPHETNNPAHPIPVKVENDPVDRRHWHHFWAHAVATDLAWRREREAAAPGG